jgi:hypothetical protein
MAPREIIHDAAIGTRLVEVRHEMPRGLSVSRYLLVRPGDSGPHRFTTLRKARAAFRAQTDEPGLGVAAGTQDA